VPPLQQSLPLLPLVRSWYLVDPLAFSVSWGHGSPPPPGLLRAFIRVDTVQLLFSPHPRLAACTFVSHGQSATLFLFFL
jgi:hypothetical protein